MVILLVRRILRTLHNLQIQSMVRSCNRGLCHNNLRERVGAGTRLLTVDPPVHAGGSDKPMVFQSARLDGEALEHLR